MSTHELESNTTSSEIPLSDISNNIFKYKIEKDDPLWKQYVEKAAPFDERLLDEWTKIVDVIIVSVALFISVLTSFVIVTTNQLQRNPADITNDLLVEIIKRLTDHATTTFDADAVFRQNIEDYDSALSRNILLYTSLSLCILVSVMALAAKLWLVSYARDAFSTGSPYERAMKRQEMYNGILAWRMGAVIHSLPVILLIALVMFGFVVHLTISPIQTTIGFVVGAILALGLILLLVTSFTAAFIPSCPFRSSISTTVQYFWRSFEKLSRRMLRGLSEKSKRWLWIGSLASLWLTSSALVIYASMVTIGRATGYLVLICIPAAIVILYAVHEKEQHKPQEYELPRLVFYIIIMIAPPILAMAPIAGLPRQLCYPINFSLYAMGMLALLVAGYMGSRMAKSMVETGEVDAIAWLLKSTSSQYPESFKKAGQIASLGDGLHYRPRLLKSLMPLLSHLITSHRNDRTDMLEDLGIYVSCLAILSDFVDDKGSFFLMREDARQHPKLDSDLFDKLVELAKNSRPTLRSSSIKVLKNYGLYHEDHHGPYGNRTRKPLVGAPTHDGKGGGI